MQDVALKLLKKITSHGYQAYIVGGFVRDSLLNINSKDIDITTNATPKEIKEIFEDSCLPCDDYGAVKVEKHGVQFEITTFRKEIQYVDNRKPVEIKYIDDLYEDLLRRDFTINTICMDENGKIIDYLNGRNDLDNKVIRTVGNAKERFEEDSLRILRAVRFATILDFSLDQEIIDAILEVKTLVRNLSYYRKKIELEKIFTSPNYKNGIKLIIELGLDEELELQNLEKVLNTDTIGLMGIWSIVNVQDKYPFNKNEMDLIRDINQVIGNNPMDAMILYRYGLYVNSVAGEIQGYDIKAITEAYASLPIKSRKDIQIDAEEIMDVLGKAPGEYLKDIYEDIEREILYHRLDNDKKAIVDFVIHKYKDEVDYEKDC